jgi:hypothetical protein
MNGRFEVVGGRRSRAVSPLNLLQSVNAVKAFSLQTLFYRIRVPNTDVFLVWQSPMGPAYTPRQFLLPERDES